MNHNDTAALRSYDAMLARGPLDAPVADAMIDYSIVVGADFSLDALTKAVGGDAHFSSDIDEDGNRDVTGTTVVEEVEHEDAARDIMLNLLEKVTGVDMDDPDITVRMPEEDDFIDPLD